MQRHRSPDPASAVSGDVRTEEAVSGLPLRFRYKDDVLKFGIGSTTHIGDPPLNYRHATDHIRKEIDRHEVLRFDDYTFLGYATTYVGIEYNWNKIPSYVGCDIYNEEQNEFLGAKEVERIHSEIGLSSQPTTSNEESVYRDGTVRGIEYRQDRNRYVSLNPVTTKKEIRTDITQKDVNEFIEVADTSSFEELRRHVMNAVYRRYVIADTAKLKSSVSQYVRAALE